jgi:hypothetical protein
MATIVTRAGKGSPLTNTEVDANFTNLNTELGQKLVASDATSANTASKIVQRDASGNFSAGTITASLSGNATTSSSTSGNAATATALQTARTINGTSFNGTANIVVTAEANGGNAATATALQTARLIGGVSFNGTANINLPGVNTAGNQNTSGSSASCTGNSATATALQTARLIGGVSFNGTANIDLPGVNTAGNQNTSGSSASCTGNAATATTANGLNSANSYTAVAFTASSDERVKTNWRELPADFIEQLAKVKHGTFDRTDSHVTQDGVSAQSLSLVLQNSVLTDTHGRMSVNYGGAALVSAVALAQRIVQQDAKIARLEQLVEKLIEG